MCPTDLRYPAYSLKAGEELIFLDKVMMDEAELTRFMNSEAGGKNLLIQSYAVEINDKTLSGDETVIAQEYRGQWRQDNPEVWEGIGMIKFSDGSMYQG